MEKVDLLKYEHELYEQGYNLIAGCDEAGRGPLCGPVVAAAVILPKDYKLEGLNDSKQLSEKKRDKFFEIIKKDAISYGISIIDAKTIDEVNIYEASRMAMLDAISKLSVKPDFIITDAMPLKKTVKVEIAGLYIVNIVGMKSAEEMKAIAKAKKEKAKEDKKKK